MSLNDVVPTDDQPKRQPGEIIRPQLTLDVAKQMVERLYGLRVVRLKELDSYDDRNYFIEAAEEHNNPNIDVLWPHGYVFKVLNTIGSRKNHVVGEHACAEWLTKAGFLVSRPVLNIHGCDISREFLPRIESETSTTHQRQQDGAGTVHIVRLLVYIPGILMKEVVYTTPLAHCCGRYLGRLHMALKGFQHADLAGRDLIWNLDNISQLRDFMIALKDQADARLIAEVISSFENNVLQKKDKFRIGTIYNDFNEGNVLLKPADSGDGYDISGLIDLGDMTCSCIVYDIAIAIMYLMLGAAKDEMLAVGRHALAGFQSEFPLTEQELEALKVCVAARFAQSVVMATYSALKEPDNEYAQVGLKTGWHCLRTLWETPQEELYEEWGISGS